MSVPTKCHWAPFVGRDEIEAALKLTVRNSMEWASLPESQKLSIDSNLADIADRIVRGRKRSVRNVTEHSPA